MSRLLKWSLLLGACISSATASANERVDAIFAPFTRDGSPGCALSVYKDGQIAYERGYGLADINQGVAITPETVFYIASTSKQFTAFAIARLADEGALSLDDPIRRHVPELPEWGDRITVDQLVHHTSGIPDYLSLWDTSGRSYADEIPLAQAIELISRQNLAFEPGSQWTYSNSNYLLLAEIVARATSGSLRAYAEKTMFAPLGMTSTAFHDDATRIVPRRAEGYLPDGQGGFRIFRTSFALVGDGGLLTNVRDLLKWDSNFYDNRLGGGAALIEKVTTPGSLSDGSPLTAPPYAFGLEASAYKGLPMVQHAGGFIGFSAQLVRFPTQRLSVAVLCNSTSAPAAALAMQVADLYLAGTSDAPPQALPAVPSAAAAVSVPADQLARWTGRYYVSSPIILATVVLNDGQLALQAAGGPVPLTPTSPETFTTPILPGIVRFSMGEDGQPSLLIEGVGQSVPARRLPALAATDAATWAKYAGRYESAALDTWFEVRPSEGGLELRRRFQPVWEKLNQLDRDSFATARGPVRFSRNGAGEVTGLVVVGGRIAEITFEKAP